MIKINLQISHVTDVLFSADDIHLNEKKRLARYLYDVIKIHDLDQVLHIVDAAASSFRRY